MPPPESPRTVSSVSVAGGKDRSAFVPFARWARNFWFRMAHLAAIAFVALEALAGVLCPLTVWEAALRGSRADKSFIAQWVHRVLYYDWPEWVFTALHVGFALLVAATWYFIRPKRR